MEQMSTSPLRPSVWELPPGRHGLARELVTGSQRQRLLHAVTAAVAELGYSATTVADVVARAGVSRKTFYEHFNDKLDCFLAASDVGREALMSAVLAVAEHPVQDPVEQLRRVVHTYLGFVASEPAFARAFFVEVVAAGQEAQARRGQCRAELIVLLEAWHESLIGSHPEHRLVPASAYAAAMGAADTLLCEYLRDHAADGLTSLEADVSYACLAILGMPGAAASVAASASLA